MRGDALAFFQDLGPAGTAYAPQLAPLLKDADLRDRAMEALGRMGPIDDISAFLAILSEPYDEYRPTALDDALYAYLYRDLRPMAPEAQRDLKLIRWLKYQTSDERRRALDQLNRTDALAMMAAFKSVWEPANDFPRLREEMAVQLADFVREEPWSHADVALLQGLEERLHSADFSEPARAFHEALAKIR